MPTHLTTLLLSLAMVLLTGCGKSPEAAAPSQAGAPPAPKAVTTSKPRIAVIPKGTAHVFWQTVYAGARAAGEELGVEILWKGPAKETEYTRQIDIIEDYLAQGVDALVIAPTEQHALVPVVEKAFASGKPVIIFDSGIETDKYHSFVATDNRHGGVLAGRAMGQLLAGKGQVAAVLCAPGGASTLLREAGFRETVQQEFPEIKLVAEKFGMSDRAKSLAVAEDMLAANKELVALFGSNESSTVGALNAIKNAGLAGKVKLIGFDSSDELVQGLRDGAIEALVVQNPWKMGNEAVRAAVRRLNGEDLPKLIDTGVEVVTKANLDSPATQALLNPKLD